MFVECWMNVKYIEYIMCEKVNMEFIIISLLL